MYVVNDREDLLLWHPESLGDDLGMFYWLYFI